LGKVYVAKISGKLSPVRLDEEDPHGGWRGTNLRTKREVRIRSARKLRRERQPKKGDEKAAAEDDAQAQPVDGVCKTCGRTVRLPGAKARCECGQALLNRGGRVTRINETPKGCLKDLPLAETLAEPEPEPTPTRKRADGKLSGLDAAAQVLAEADEPLKAKTMVERMLDQDLWATSGKTPAATIYSAMLREIKQKGDESRFAKVGRGTFALAE
ncbi:MAG: winged helix-turn-helix domain-containing protein, partial [Planctomycetota bacterium]